jgi:hypothetical protein
VVVRVATHYLAPSLHSADPTHESVAPKVEAVLALCRCCVAVTRVSFGYAKSRRFLDNIEGASVRAGCRQVNDVVAIVIENTLRPVNADYPF